jgi:Enoyl-(Acyl carrier protein) reductase
VINISSVLALTSGRGFLSYGTAKGALARYTELAAQDLAPRIRVNAIAAGTIATAATEVITADAGLRSRVEAATPLRRLPLGRHETADPVRPDAVEARIQFVREGLQATMPGTKELASAPRGTRPCTWGYDRHRRAAQCTSWMRTRLPAGSRKAQSRIPYGCSTGSWTTSASLACSRSKVPSRSLVARRIQP